MYPSKRLYLYIDICFRFIWKTESGSPGDFPLSVYRLLVVQTEVCRLSVCLSVCKRTKGTRRIAHLLVYCTRICPAPLSFYVANSSPQISELFVLEERRVFLCAIWSVVRSDDLCSRYYNQPIFAENIHTNK
jgi:hypothetical protein